jgi:hypothetical protein
MQLTGMADPAKHVEPASSSMELNVTEIQLTLHFTNIVQGKLSLWARDLTCDAIKLGKKSTKTA